MSRTRSWNPEGDAWRDRWSWRSGIDDIAGFSDTELSEVAAAMQVADVLYGEGNERRPKPRRKQRAQKARG